MRSITAPRLERAERTAWVDVCATIMDVCHTCQIELLDPRGITCLVDVDGGMLTAAQCNALARIVRQLIGEICGEAPDDRRGGQITVALHHKGKCWVLAVADEGVRVFNRKIASVVAPSLQTIARSLNGTVRTRLTPQGSVTAVLFTVRKSVHMYQPRSALHALDHAPEPLEHLPNPHRWPRLRNLARRAIAYH